MGTNYYLRKRKKLNLYLPIEIIVLENGYVFENVYYPSLTLLEKNYYEQIHIGKRSAGWLFVMEKSKKYNCIEDFINELNNTDTIGIFDEYNEQISLEEFIDIVKRNDYDFSNKPPQDISANTIISNYKCLCYSKYDEIKMFQGVPYRLVLGKFS